ncbi:hypothetical protein [Clostridium sp. YIM B02506]|nr:hypothetical protein [Clostridium sp. YIM B02506]
MIIKMWISKYVIDWSSSFSSGTIIYKININGLMKFGHIQRI